MKLKTVVSPICDCGALLVAEDRGLCEPLKAGEVFFCRRCKRRFVILTPTIDAVELRYVEPS